MCLSNLLFLKDSLSLFLNTQIFPVIRRLVNYSRYFRKYFKNPHTVIEKKYHGFSFFPVLAWMTIL